MDETEKYSDIIDHIKSLGFVYNEKKKIYTFDKYEILLDPQYFKVSSNCSCYGGKYEDEDKDWFIRTLKEFMEQMDRIELKQSGVAVVDDEENKTFNQFFE